MFTDSYGQVSGYIPIIVGAPFYFAGKIQLGVLLQVARAFGNVNTSLTFFITYYAGLADFRAVLDRLTSFDDAIARAQHVTKAHEGQSIEVASRPRTRRRSPFDRGPHELKTCRRRPAPFGAPSDGRVDARRPWTNRHLRRPVRNRQVDAIPGDRRHLALWRGRDRRAQGQAYAAAATALYSARDAAKRDRLSERGLSLQRRRHTRCAPSSRLAAI